MSNREVMQQALEALEFDGFTPEDATHCHYTTRAITALKAALEQPEQQAEPTPWRDMVVVTLVREGINKHRARELADHFAAQPEPPPEWEAINNIIAEYGLDAIAFVAEWKAAQRPWQGLTDEDRFEFAAAQHGWEDLLIAAEATLKEKNNV